MLAVIKEEKLDSWVDANAHEAQGTIVDLVWRLVAASCPNPLERRFPLGDSIGQHGPDGILHVKNGYAPFVPDGYSFWEIGTGRGARDKATKDYKDLTCQLSADVRRESTFVFVTPRSGKTDWEYTWKEGAQAAWIEKRRKTEEWKDVRVIDGSKLIDWIHQFPAIEIWLAGKIHGSQMEHIETLERRWDVIRSFGEPPPLTPDVFLINRDDACQKLQEVFDGNSSHLKLITRYPIHAVDFVCAYLASLEEELRIEVSGRTLIISNIDAWNTVCELFQRDNLILIADPATNLSGYSGSTAIQKATNAGHAVIFDAPPGGQADPTGIFLTSPRAHQIKEALLAAGHPEQRAHKLSYRCDKNLSFLLCLLQGLSVQSELAASPSASELPYALLVGSWRHCAEADRTIIQRLTGIGYEEWIKTMREISVAENSPVIFQIGDWKFIPRFEGWYALGEKLHDEHLDALHSVAVSVLREEDPQFELPPEERYLAEIKGKVFKHSPPLRKGIAESLALLGSHPQALSSCSRAKAEYTANRTINVILSDADWVVWASLDGLLPLLSEASPDEFLAAVENALNQTPCPFDQLFAQEGCSTFGQSYPVGLLWALENLAWEEQFLVRASELLGRLSRFDQGGNRTNSPSDSLTRIFLPWFPQTTASVQKRIVAVRTLIREVPLAGWRLLMGLLPSQQGCTHSTHRPSWRDTIPEDWKEDASQHEYIPKFNEQVEAYAEMLVEMACSDFERVSDSNFINQLQNLPSRSFDCVIDHLSSEAVCGRPEDQRIGLWTELSRFVRWHRKFPESRWALRPENISDVERVVEKLSPKDLSTIRLILFSSEAFLLYDETEDRDESERRANELRQAAVEEVLSSEGIEAVIRLAQDVEHPNHVGYALAALAGTEIDVQLLPALLDRESEKLQHFAKGYVWNRRYRKGCEWADNLNIQNWTTLEKAKLLSWLPFEEEAWQRVEALLGSQAGEYWRIVNANPYGVTGKMGYAIDKLIENGRPKAAIKCIWVMLEKGTFNRDQAVLALLSAVSSDEPIYEEFRHEVTEIIKALQEDLENNHQFLFAVEWAYLGLLDHHVGASPIALESGLALDPDLYCSVIHTVFLSEGEAVPAEQINEQENAIKRNAYSLLFGWKTPPGMQPDGTFLPEAFIDWLDRVKVVCSESGLLGIALEQVGEVLIHCPPDPDGLWIHHAVAKALNDEKVEAMREGFSIGISNSREMHWVDPTGKPERELADEYRKKADEIENASYQRLAKTLRGIAKDYDREAERVIAEEARRD